MPLDEISGFLISTHTTKNSDMMEIGCLAAVSAGDRADRDMAWFHKVTSI